MLEFLTCIFFSFFADCAAPSNKSSTSDDKGNSNQINPDELKKRTEFLKAQRDKLLAMKRAEREKQLEVRSHHIFFTNSEFSICNFVIKNNGYIGILYSYIQGMSCEGACAHAHVRCAVARVCVCVRAKSILKNVWDVRACGSFFGVRCAIALLHTFWNKIDRKCYFLNYSRTSYPILEHPFLLKNMLS